MSVVGAAVILGLLVALLVKMKIARPSVVVVCVVFGLVLGASPIGHTVDTALSAVGGWLSGQVKAL